MKLKIISIAIASLCLSQSILAQTKTLDFYSSNANRYSVSGKVKDLNFPINNNSILITGANSDAYVKLNQDFPYHLNFIANDLNLYQIIEQNKGKLISYKGNQVKIIGSQNDRVIVELDNNVMFVPFNEISIPKSFLSDSNKGLKATFTKIEQDDTLYFSQPERQLNYSNSYESVIRGNKISLAHYLNINNSSSKSFENVYLNFFLSETNIQQNVHLRMPPPMMAMAKSKMESADMSNVADPVFENNDIQNLKSISIKDAVTIYPNFNKIKYVEKSYEIEQFVKVNIDERYDIYLGDEVPKNVSLKELKTVGSSSNIIYLKELLSLKENIKQSIVFKNKLNIKVGKNDILPPGKLDVYEGVNGQDKLIVSTNIAHNENKDLEILKSKNNDLKIIDVKLEIVDNLSLNNLDLSKRVRLNLKELEIENNGSEEYLINVFGKKTTVPSKSKIIIKL